MARPGITMIQSFTYRQAVEEFSNQYHFLGDAPSDEAGWNALCTELLTLLIPIFPATVTFKRAYAYDDTAADSVYTIELPVFAGPPSGSLSVSSGSYQAPGDSAMWIRWKTARVNSKGRPIYLRKYYHGVVITPESGDGDLIFYDQRAALDTLAGALNTTTGDWPGLCGPDGVAPGAHTHSIYATTRTLKRRGARPH